MPHSFENYELKSKTYTALRRAIGVDKQLAHFARNEAPLEAQFLLDAGCGTGNYLVEYVEKFKSVHAADYSEGMLSEARANLAHRDAETSSENGLGLKEKVIFTKEDISNLAHLPEGSFDAITFNQVVHHLRPDNDFMDFRNAANGFYRLLRPGGRVVMNWSPPQNMQEAFYWAELIPDALAKLLPRSPPKEKVEQILESAGFVSIEFEPVNEILYDPDMYFNPRSFLNIERFRLCDSTFNLATEEELARAVEKVKKMDDGGTLDAWFQEREVMRKKFGQTVNAYAVK